MFLCSNPIKHKSEDGSPAKVCVCFYILQFYLIKLFSYNQFYRPLLTELDLECVYVYYRQFDSYGVHVPILFQELFVIITMM